MRIRLRDHRVKRALVNLPLLRCVAPDKAMQLEQLERIQIDLAIRGSLISAGV